MESERNLYRQEINRLKANIERIDQDTNDTMARYKNLSPYITTNNNSE